MNSAEEKLTGGPSDLVDSGVPSRPRGFPTGRNVVYDFRLVDSLPATGVQ